MQVKIITVTRGATINTGNFNSARVDVSMTAELNGDRDETIAAMNLTNIVLDELERQIMDMDLLISIRVAQVAILRGNK